MERKGGEESCISQSMKLQKRETEKSTKQNITRKVNNLTKNSPSKGCHFLTFQNKLRNQCASQVVSRCSKALSLLVSSVTHSCRGRALRDVLHSSTPSSLHHWRSLALVHCDTHKLREKVSFVSKNCATKASHTL